MADSRCVLGNFPPARRGAGPSATGALQFSCPKFALSRLCAGAGAGFASGPCSQRPLFHQSLGTSRVHLPLPILGGSRLLHTKWHKSYWISRGYRDLSLRPHAITAHVISEIWRAGSPRTCIQHVCCLTMLDASVYGRLSRCTSRTYIRMLHSTASILINVVGSRR